MPRKIRVLFKDPRTSEFLPVPGGKGSHRKYEHPAPVVFRSGLFPDQCGHHVDFIAPLPNDSPPQTPIFSRNKRSFIRNYASAAVRVKRFSPPRRQDDLGLKRNAEGGENAEGDAEGCFLGALGVLAVHILPVSADDPI